MGAQSPNILKNIQLKNIKANEYEAICLETNKILSTYSIKSELYSTQVWDFLTKKFNITDESNITTHTDIDLDEKNNKHYSYQYIIKVELDSLNKNIIFLTFNDEKRGYDDKDYHGYVTPEDKSNKIFNLNIYYDATKIPTKELEELLISKLLKCSYSPNINNQFFTIVHSNLGYSLKPSYVKELDIDIELNYGEDFIDTHKQILDKLKNLKHGLFLFHGESGTGKTTYLRKLISLISMDKTVVYVPSYMIASIADPEFIAFISSIKDGVLLLEDAENVLSNTVNDRSQAISNILNITDGLLNDYLNLQIIATFNTHIKSIDKALIRAGRLLVNQEFRKLKPVDANKLSKKLNKNIKYTEDTTLSEIYEGTNQIINTNVEKKIGFKK